MEIKFVQGIAGPNYSFAPGDSTDTFDDKQAIRLCKAGIAIPVKDKKVEKAVKKPAETSSKFPEHVGGGWYELSNGEKIQGKEEAAAAEKDLG